ncbi:MAG: hypothetical protein EBU84_13300 [Actinobacteria bacterium]|nr:hypothetical protein [Actinomycetota bacterium]
MGVFFCLVAQKIAATPTRKMRRVGVVFLPMGIEYKTNPTNFEELCDSVRGQVERARELSIKGETVPFDEMVELSSESFLSLLDRVEQLSEIVSHQATLFVQINEIFKWVFNYVGIDIERVIAEEIGLGLDSEDDASEEG